MLWPWWWGDTVWRMCDDHEHPAVTAWSAPRAAEGPAVDPVTLPAVDEVTVTTMVSVRGRGLVVITGCGHAGVVNIIRHAMRLTGVHRLLAVIGGFHLSGRFRAGHRADRRRAH